MNPSGLERPWWDSPWLARRGFAETLACALAALIYVATLSFGFVYDDVPQILKNPAVHSWNFLPQYFTAHVWAALYPNSAGNYYRPIFLLWLRLNYAVFGTHAAGWHLTSVVCHVLGTWLVFRVVRQLAGDRATAFVAALIFGLHPVHIENIAWISGVTDLLMTCFVLGSFSAFLGFRRSGGIRRACLAVMLFGLALLSKETAIVLPALVLVYLIIVGRLETSVRPFPGAFARSWALLAALVGAVLVYFAVRFHALHGWSHSTVTIDWQEIFLSWPSVLWFYAKHLVWPVGLSEFYSVDYVAQYSTAAVLMPLALLLVAALAALFALWLIRGPAEKKLARFALVFIVFPLFPVLDLRSLTAGDIVHDRYLYLPSVGFALFLALVIREIARRSWPSGAEANIISEPPVGTAELVPFPVSAPTKLDPQPTRAKVAAGFVGIIALVFAALTISQQMPWASDILLYTRGLESAPANLTVRDNLANALMDANQPGRAIPLYLEVLERNPAFWRSNYNLGFAYYKSGNSSGAEEYLTRAIRIDPRDSDQYIYLALTEVQLKNFAAAAENARQAIALNPHARGYHSVAAIIYEAAGDLSRASAEFKAEMAEHPDNTAAPAELRRLESGQSSPRP